MRSPSFLLGISEVADEPMLRGRADRCISNDLTSGYTGRVAKTLIDVDERYLAAAAEVLHTATKKDTINAALREVAALAARRRDLQRLMSDALPDLGDEDVMRHAWRQ